MKGKGKGCSQRDIIPEGVKGCVILKGRGYIREGVKKDWRLYAGGLKGRTKKSKNFRRKTTPISSRSDRRYRAS